MQIETMGSKIEKSLKNLSLAIKIILKKSCYFFKIFVFSFTCTVFWNGYTGKQEQYVNKFLIIFCF